MTVATAVRARLDGAALTFTGSARAVSLVTDSIARAPVASYVVAAGNAETSARVSLALVRANVGFDEADTWLNLECAARTPAPAAPAAEYTATYVTSHAVTTGTVVGVPASLGVAGTSSTSTVVYSRTEPHALGAVRVSLARDASATINVEVAESAAGPWTRVATQTATGVEREIAVTPRPASFTRVSVTSTERVLNVAPTFVEPRSRVGVALVANGTKVRVTQRSVVGSLWLSKPRSGATSIAGVTVASTTTSRVGGIQTELCALSARMPTLPSNLYAVFSSSVFDAEHDPIAYRGVHYAALNPTDVSIVSVLCAADSSSTRALHFGDWSVSVSSTSVSAADQTWTASSAADTREVAVAWRAGSTKVYCDWVEVLSLSTQTRNLRALGAQGQTSARFASLRLRAESSTTTASVASFAPTWTAVLAANDDDCDSSGLSDHEYAALALGAMPPLPSLVPAITVAPKFSHVLRNSGYVFTVTSPVSLEPFTMTTDPVCNIAVAGTTATLTTSGTSITASEFRVYLNGADVTPASIAFPALYSDTTVTLTSTAPSAISPFEACTYATRNLALAVAGVPVSAVSVGTLVNCTASATLTSSSRVTVACKATDVTSSFQLTLTGPDGRNVTLTKSLYVLTVPTPTWSIAAGTLCAVGVQLSLVATYTVGSSAYATDMHGLAFSGRTATYSTKAVSGSTVLVTVTYTPENGTTPTLGVRVSDKAATPGTLLDSDLALGAPYAVPTALTSVTCEDYPFPGDSLCMADIDAAMSASVAVPTGTTLTNAARGLPGGPGTAYGITDATLSSGKLTFKMRPPTYVPTGAERHTAVTFTFTGPDGHSFDVALVLTADSFLKWPSLLGGTTSEPEVITLKADRLIIRFPFTGDKRIPSEIPGNITTFSGGYSRDDNQTGAIVPQTSDDHATTLTLTIAPRASAPTRPMPGSLTRPYASTTVPGSRIVEKTIPTIVRLGEHKHVEEANMLVADFETDKTTPSAAVTVRGIGIKEVTWKQGVDSKIEINKGVNQQDPCIFARVTTTMRYVFSRSSVFHSVLTYELPNVIAASESNSHQFFTHEATFDSTRPSWSQCRAALKYCTRTVPGPPRYTGRTLLMQNSTSLKYELQDVYTDPLSGDEITAANTHVRMITTNADTNAPPSGILKMDLRSVASYTLPFTIFALREGSPSGASRPSITYMREDGFEKLVVTNNGSTHKSTCTLPTSCRIVYRYGTSGGVLVMLEPGGTSTTTTHTLSNFGQATTTPVFTSALPTSSTNNGIAIFHHCVARAELVVSPSSREFTAEERSALMSWASTSSA